MKIVLAFDSFKGCLTAEEACRAAEEGVRRAGFGGEVVCVPLSDGGEGLVQCFLRMGKAHEVMVRVHGPLMEEVVAKYAISEDGETAYMEMASACGLTLVPMEKRNPLETTTYGLGEMLKDAVERGVKHIVLGIGGSATCDGGMGMLEALDAWQSTIGACSSPLSRTRRVRQAAPDGYDQSHPTGAILTVACDVNNPLYGREGAAYVFAPQKGATAEQVVVLDRRLRAFAMATEEMGLATKEDAFHPGAGAAGGLGYALLTYLGAELKRGIEVVMEAMGFDEALRGADVVVTGEGCSDEQTVHGKVAAGVLGRAQALGVKTVLMSGVIKDREVLEAYGFNRVYGINEGDSRSMEELMQAEVAKENIRRTCQRMLEEGL